MKNKTVRMKRFDAAIGSQIMKHRRERKLTREDLAEKLGMYPLTLGRYERGTTTMPFFFLLRAAATLRVTLADLASPAIATCKDDTHT